MQAEPWRSPQEIAQCQLPWGTSKPGIHPQPGEKHGTRNPATTCNTPNKWANFSLLSPLARRDPQWFKLAAQGAGAAGTPCLRLATAAWFPPSTQHPQELPQAETSLAAPPQYKGQVPWPWAGLQLGDLQLGLGLLMANKREHGEPKWDCEQHPLNAAFNIIKGQILCMGSWE